MSIEKLMHNYADYNLWANKTLANWLAAQPDDLMTKNTLSSFPSIIKTFSHLWDTEKFWLAVLQGSSRQAWATFTGTNDEVIPGLLGQSEVLSCYIKSQDEASLLEQCHLDTQWLKGQIPKYEMIQHCINHGTYHRGQIITISRNVGITDPPTTDYNYYNMVWKNKHQEI
jgi:uncharacterized damage-inducible protein DinB